ncbi:MAG TPA: glucose 1-dehydrogenase [Alphaproteobacteria bacterium]|nr:glucose 1-dehydrogenase [Alphaproteobacteria bacterium]
MTEPFALEGVTALVTGASSGLGRHFALTLARSGARVAVCARRADKLAALVAEIEEFDGRAMAFALDVTDVASVHATVDAAETELGALSVVVNNAGVEVTKLIIEMTEEDYDRVLDTNTKGVFMVAQECAKRMIQHGRGGSIINIASMAAVRPLKGLSTYCISKAAVAHMTKVMALEWARYGIRVNALAPGYVETEMNTEFFASEHGQKMVAGFPRRRLGKPQDLDGMLLLMASAAGDYMTGSVVLVDDGMSLSL